MPHVWKLEVARLLAKHHYTRCEIETFCIFTNLARIYEEHQDKSTINAYYYALVEFKKIRAANVNYKNELKEILNKMNWNLVKDKIFDKQAHSSKQKIFTDEAKQFGVIPYCSRYIERTDKMTDIDTMLVNNEKTEETVIVACTGLCGVGKTSLISQYVKINLYNYRLIAWFNADTVETLFSELKNFIKNFTTQSLRANGNASINDVIIDFQNFFREYEHKWLVVFDNVKPETSSIINKFKFILRGRILITSRFSTFFYEKNLMLEEFTVDQAIEFLKLKIENKITILRTNDNSNNKNSSEVMKEIVTELACNPWLIDHVAFHLCATQKSIEQYLEELKNNSWNIKLPNDNEEIVIKTNFEDKSTDFHECYRAIFYSIIPLVENVLSSDIKIDKQLVERKKVESFLFQISFLQSNTQVPLKLFRKSENILMKLREHSLITKSSDYFLINRLVQESIQFYLCINYRKVKKEGKVDWCSSFKKTDENNNDLNDYRYSSSGISKYLKKAFLTIEQNYPIGKSELADIELKKELIPHFKSLLQYHEFCSERLENYEIYSRKSANKGIITYSQKSKDSKTYDISFISLIIEYNTINEKNMFLLANCLKLLKYKAKCQPLSQDQRYELINFFQFRKSFLFIREYFKTKNLFWVKKIKKKLPSNPSQNYLNYELLKSYDLELNGFLNGRDFKRSNQYENYKMALDKQTQFDLNSHNKKKVKKIADVFYENPTNCKIDRTHFVKFLNCIQERSSDFDNDPKFHCDKRNFKKLFLNWVQKYPKDLPVEIIYNVILNTLKWKDSHIRNEILSEYDAENTQIFYDSIVEGEFLIASQDLKYAKGIDIESTDEFRLTPMLHAAVQNSNFVKLVYKRGGAISSRDDTGKTPLHLAVFHKKETIVRFFLSKNAVIDIVDNELKTALHYAVVYSHLDIFLLLIEKGASLNVKDMEGNTPLHIACGMPNKEIFSALVNSEIVNEENNYKETPLSIASYHCNLEYMKVLLKMGAKANVTDVENQTLFHKILSENPSKKCVKLLLNENIDIHERDSKGRTALHICASTNRGDIMKFLLAHGAELGINTQDLAGNTALHYAVESFVLKSYMLESKTAIDVLLKRNANVEIYNSRQQTPLDLALELKYSYRYDERKMETILDVISRLE